MKQHKWVRVNKQFPCGACGKFDWCTYAPEVGLLCCMRLASSKPAKNGGWLHSMGDAPRPPLPVRAARPVPTINCGELLRSWTHSTGDLNMEDFAASLGVKVDALYQLNCCRSQSHSAWAFPMRDGRGAVTGIRLRYDNGDKRAVTGSRAGIFIPDAIQADTVYVGEGPTDVAALLTMGLFAIGRPSCSGGVTFIQDYLKRNRVVRRVVIVADVDQDREINGQVINPGITGAKTLQEHLPVPSVIVTLPCKDSREFLRRGGTKTMIESMVSSLVWRKPTV